MARKDQAVINIGGIVVKEEKKTGGEFNSFAIFDRSLPLTRKKNITFKVEGLLPSTVFYPFFDGVYVGEYCSGTLTSNADGVLVGIFSIPEDKFQIGELQFLVVDNIVEKNGVKIPAPIESWAENFYIVDGEFLSKTTSVQGKFPSKYFSSNELDSSELNCSSYYFVYSCLLCSV